MVDIGPCMRRRLKRYRNNSFKATLSPWALVEPKSIIPPDPAVRKELFRDVDLALLYSGNMGKAHDFSLFLQLARKLYPKNPKIKICFSCRGNRYRELRKAVSSEDRNISFVPFADESKLKERLLAADIHLLSLRPEWEGIVVPSKFFGSIAVGRPVMYSGPKNSSIAEWIEKFDLGLILSHENIDECVEKLITIAKNPAEKLKKWSENAFKTYQSHFSKKKIMDQWDELLRNFIEEIRVSSR